MLFRIRIIPDTHHQERYVCVRVLGFMSALALWVMGYMLGLRLSLRLGLKIEGYRVRVRVRVGSRIC